MARWWLMENRTAEEQEKVWGDFTIPPRGWTGSLHGTPWDPEAMLADFDTAQAQYSGAGGG